MATTETGGISLGNLMPVGPGQTELLVHFSGRPAGRPATPLVPAEVRALTPEQRLERILAEGRLRGFPPFGAEFDQPMVCFSASPLDHLQALLKRGWPSWGLIVRRQWVYDLGGAPVRHLRPEHYEQRARHDKPWSVRLDTRSGSYSDWTDELEWRLPVRPDQPYLPLRPQDLVALLVADASWDPEEDTYYLYSDGEMRHWSDPEVYADPSIQPVEPVGQWIDIPRWHWDSESQRVDIDRNRPKSV